MTIDKKTAKENLKVILDKYNKFKDSDALKVEANAEKIIEDIFEKVLGWESLEDYIKRKSQETGKFPDYTFRLNGINKFFLEAKKLDANLDTIAFQKQAIGYARSSAVPFGILTNFKELRVYVVDREIDNIKNFDKIQLFKPILIENCLEDSEFEKLWMFSKESFLNKKIYAFAEEICKLPKRKEIDDQLSIKLNYLREKIKTNIRKHDRKNEVVLSNENVKLLIEEVTQRILDRLVFIRVCEDREYENKHLESFLNAHEQNNSFKIWDAIRSLFRDYDIKNEKTGVGGYDSGLFELSLCDSLFLEDDILAKVIKEFYYFEDGTPIDFSKIPADILGNLYENYLAHISRNVETQKLHRREEGIFYTPAYIVDYIVKNTLGELLKDKKTEIDKIKILDPSCGSGSFLIKTFDFIDDYHKKKDNYSQKRLAEDGSSYSTKERILRNNLFGVDLDAKAVEIAQLNLLLKIAEKGHKLPILQKNIKRGNSLIDNEKIAPKDYFKWEGYFQEGTFDIVIGNPPYGIVFNEEEKLFLENKFSSFKRNNDLYVAFIEKSIDLLKEGGLFSFIIPNTYILGSYFENLKEIILKKTKIIKIIDFGINSIFRDPNVFNSIIILQKETINDKKLKNKIEFLTVPPLSEAEIINFEKYSLKTELMQSNLDNQSWKPKNKIVEKMLLKKDKLIENVCYVKDVGFNYWSVGRGKKRGDSIGSRVLYEGERKNQKDIPYLKGRDIIRWSYSFSNHWLKHNYNEFLNKKTDTFRFSKEFLETSPKIIYRQTADRIIATLDYDKNYNDKTVHLIVPKEGTKINLLSLLGILNSNLILFFYRNIVGEEGRTFAQVKTIYLKNIPFVTNELIDDRLSKLVKNQLEKVKIIQEIGNKLTSEKTKIQEEIDRTDKEINQEVYKLYGITKEEQEIIENSLNPPKK